MLLFSLLVNQLINSAETIFSKCKVLPLFNWHFCVSRLLHFMTLSLFHFLYLKSRIHLQNSAFSFHTKHIFLTCPWHAVSVAETKKMKLIPFYNHNSQTKVAALKTGLMSFLFLDEFVRATKKKNRKELTYT